jgi:pimeloyl-ACP methyl ester carboxylesterase
MSDRVTAAPSLRDRIADILAVMQAEGIERASVLGVSEGALMPQHFAATCPERVERLVLVNAVPGLAALAELSAYSEKPLPSLEEGLGRFARLVETWGREPEFMAEWFIPSQCRSASFLRWLGRFQRQSASPADLRRQIENVGVLSIPKSRLASTQAPTLVVHVKGDRVQPLAAGRYLAANIPGAELLEVEGEDHFCFTMPNWHEVTARLNDFLCGAESSAPAAENPPEITRSVQPSAPPLAVRDRAATLRRERVVWTVTFGGQRHGLSQVRGLCDLQYLLLRPHVDVHVGDLDAASAGPAAGAEPSAARR